MSTLIDTPRTHEEHARAYLDLGWGLIDFPRATKCPTKPGWNKPGGYYTTPEAALRWADPKAHNLGAVHAHAGTACLDLDDAAMARKAFSMVGIDLDALIDGHTGPQSIGNPERLPKLWFKAPDGVPLSTHKLSWPDPAGPDPATGHPRSICIFELRAGPVQDVLPPSIHPNGHAYQWRVAPWEAELPPIPEALLELWQQWDHYRAEMEAVLLGKPVTPLSQPKPSPRPRKAVDMSAIDAFNQAHDIHALLEAHGYVRKGETSIGVRYLAPNSSTRLAGAIVFSNTGRVYSHHGSDPLNGPHSHDAFSVYCVLAHRGDMKRAVKEAAGALGLSRLTFAKSEVTEVTEVTSYSHNGFTEDVEVTDEVTEVTDEKSTTCIIPSISRRPVFRVLEGWIETAARKYRPGVWFFGVKPSKGAESDPVLVDQWICSPLHVEAVTRDVMDNNYGRLLRFKTTLGAWREWAMPMELLKGYGEEMRGEMLAMGVEIDPLSKTLLAQYLQEQHPKRKVYSAEHVGWHEQNFVLPDRVIGPSPGEVVFQTGERIRAYYGTGGVFEEWRSGVSAMAVGNPLLALGLSCAFAGPLMLRLGAESGGIHGFGDSSTGKSTVQRAACSIWGGRDFIRSWKATDNGLEGIAAWHNDGLLVLDELGECDPRDASKIVYSLGNGVGKQRANRYGSARAVTKWRCMVFSSGEATIASHLALAGTKARAGQDVRLLNIPFSRTYGAWDTLHGHATGAAFSEAIKRCAHAHYGHAGIAFLEKLARDGRDLAPFLESAKARILGTLETAEQSGQVSRAAARFALIALAGELATEYGITGWPEGMALEAAIDGFKAWVSHRGKANSEQGSILQQVSDFIAQHGDSRFSNADSYDDAIRINRAGYWRDKDGERIYLFNNAALHEATKGYDFKLALNAMDAAGVLVNKDDKQRSSPIRINGHVMRLYAISAAKLEGACDVS